MVGMMEHPLCNALIASDMVDLADRHALWWLVDYVALASTGTGKCAKRDLVWTLRVASRDADAEPALWELRCVSKDASREELHVMTWPTVEADRISMIRFPEDLCEVTVQVVMWPHETTGSLTPTLCRPEVVKG